jgi:hypothetical protein
MYDMNSSVMEVREREPAGIDFMEQEPSPANDYVERVTAERELGEMDPSFIRVRFSREIREASASLYNLLGQNLANGSVSNSNEFILRTGKLSNGEYFLGLYANENFGVVRLQIEDN